MGRLCLTANKAKQKLEFRFLFVTQYLPRQASFFFFSLSWSNRFLWSVYSGRGTLQQLLLLTAYCAFCFRWRVGIYPSGPIALGGDFFHSHPALSTHLVAKCSVNFPASVQADFHWAGLEMKAQSRKSHTFKYSHGKRTPHGISRNAHYTRGLQGG